MLLPAKIAGNQPKGSLSRSNPEANSRKLVEVLIEGCTMPPMPSIPKVSWGKLQARAA